MPLGSESTRWGAMATVPSDDRSTAERQRPSPPTGRGARSPVTRIVVLAWGNPGRGDDALGPEFLVAAQAIAAAAGVRATGADDAGTGANTAVVADPKPSGGDVIAADDPSPSAIELEFITDFQLQPEHALDLVGSDLALFVDASTEAPAPFAFDAVAAAEDSTFTSHALSPAAVLAAYGKVVGERPPSAFVLAIRGGRFELGEPMTAAARANLDAAVAFYRRLLAIPTARGWEMQLSRRV